MGLIARNGARERGCQAASRHMRWRTIIRGAISTSAIVLLASVAAAQPGATTVPPTTIDGDSPAVDRVRSLFPRTAGWFRLVADARYEVGDDGRLVPDHSVLTHERVRRADGAGHSVIPRFARSFRGATRIGSGQEPAMHVEIAPATGRDVNARIEDGLVVYPDAYDDTDVFYKSTPTHTDEYLLIRSRRAPTTWRYVVRRGPGIAALRERGNAVEAVDARDNPWLRVSAPFAIDRRGTRVDGTVRVEGDMLVLSLDTSTLELPILVDPDWRSTGDMAYGRFYHHSNVLPDGRVLATGGCSASVCSGDLTLPACRTVVRAGETLDLRTRTWARAGDSGEARYFHAAESLPSGAVLIAGGCRTPLCDEVVGSAEVYEPADGGGGFRTVAPLGEARAGMMSARLADGRVLIAGGCTRTGCTALVEIFDPATETFTRAADLREARGRATATVLGDGRVLVAGGCTDVLCTGVLASAELYDPATNEWAASMPMATPRGGHWAAALADGSAIVGGGCAETSCATVLASAEVFDPIGLRFVRTGDHVQARFGAVAVRLPDWRVMVSQGCIAPGDCDLTNEVWDAATGSFARIEDAVTTRAFHNLVVHDGARMVIAIGGCQPRTCSWWNETYDIDGLVPPGDGGVTLPDGGVLPGRDSGTPADGGSRDGGTARDGGAHFVAAGGGGCACAAPGSSPSGRSPRAAAVVATLAAVVLPFVRRRRAKAR